MLYPLDLIGFVFVYIRLECVLDINSERLPSIFHTYTNSTLYSTRKKTRDWGTKVTRLKVYFMKSIYQGLPVNPNSHRKTDQSKSISWKARLAHYLVLLYSLFVRISILVTAQNGILVRRWRHASRPASRPASRDRVYYEEDLHLYSLIGQWTREFINILRIDRENAFWMWNSEINTG